MFSDLPSDLKKVVIKHLTQNDFISAKALYDEWALHQSQKLIQKKPASVSAKNL